MADAILLQATESVTGLHDSGIEVAVPTGYAAPAARAVARQLGIDTVFAQVLLEEKAEKIKALRWQGKVVLMVGTV